jgi:signal transduction histidine kinase
MNLVPRSLFSRLVLVLLGGLLVAQLVSFAIHMHERAELLLQASGVQSAQRVADVVRLLESSTPSERRKIVGVLSAPPLAVSLDRGPIARSDEFGEVGARAALFATMLRRFLGDEWLVEATVVDDVPSASAQMRGPMGVAKGGAGPPFGPMMHIAAQPTFSFVSQVRLHDGTLVTFDSRQSQETASWPYRLLLSLAVLLAAVVVLSLVAVRWATRPLNALADAADELGQNIDRPPLQESGPIEVVRAAHAFNTMQSRLKAYLRERTAVLAAMSHDLKTPVTRLRLRAELLTDPQLRLKFTKDLEEMESMVAAALDFLRGFEAGESSKPVDMMALLESLQADMVEIGSQVSIEGKLLKPYVGKPAALKRCLANLVENAVKYGKSALIKIDDNDEQLEIRIQDEGPGIPTAELERVFDPFYRLEGSRSRETGGTGLGLTIAQSIAEGHGGRLTLQNRSGGGLEARLTLPRAAALSRDLQIQSRQLADRIPAWW